MKTEHCVLLYAALILVIAWLVRPYLYLPTRFDKLSPE